jgi:hypothetical protein
MGYIAITGPVGVPRRPELKAKRHTVYWCGSQEATTVQDLIDACHASRLDPDCVTVEYNSRYETESDDDGILRSGIVGVAMTVNDADRRAYSLAREKYDAWAGTDEGKTAMAEEASERKRRAAEQARDDREKKLLARLRIMATSKHGLTDEQLDAINGVLDSVYGEQTEAP